MASGTMSSNQNNQAGCKCYLLTVPKQESIVRIEHINAVWQTVTTANTDIGPHVRIDLLVDLALGNRVAHQHGTQTAH